MRTLQWDDFGSLAFGFAATALLLGSYGAGLRVRAFLPPRHQTHESLEIVHAVIGMLVALVAILLGLQLDSATKSFDDVEQLVARYSVQVVQLDALLRDYGPDADPIRARLKSYAVMAAASLERGDSGDHAAQAAALRQVGLEILKLAPADGLQTHVQSDSLALINQLFQERWQLIASSHLAPSVPLYAVLMVWLLLVYGAFGLNAAFNLPVFLVLGLSALVIGAAFFVMADMTVPFGGLISVSPETMQTALVRLSQ